MPRRGRGGRTTGKGRSRLNPFWVWEEQVKKMAETVCAHCNGEAEWTDMMNFGEFGGVKFDYSDDIPQYVYLCEKCRYLLRDRIVRFLKYAPEIMSNQAK